MILLNVVAMMTISVSRTQLVDKAAQCSVLINDYIKHHYQRHHLVAVLQMLGYRNCTLYRKGNYAVSCRQICMNYAVKVVFIFHKLY